MLGATSRPVGLSPSRPASRGRGSGRGGLPGHVGAGRCAAVARWRSSTRSPRGAAADHVRAPISFVETGALRLTEHLAVLVPERGRRASDATGFDDVRWMGDGTAPTIRTRVPRSSRSPVHPTTTRSKRRPSSADTSCMRRATGPIVVAIPLMSSAFASASPTAADVATSVHASDAACGPGLVAVADGLCTHGGDRVPSDRRGHRDEGRDRCPARSRREWRAATGRTDDASVEHADASSVLPVAGAQLRRLRAGIRRRPRRGALDGRRDPIPAVGAQPVGHGDEARSAPGVRSVNG